MNTVRDQENTPGVFDSEESSGSRFCSLQCRSVVQAEGEVHILYVLCRGSFLTAGGLNQTFQIVCPLVLNLPFFYITLANMESQASVT